jgi:hypothetical protein
VDQLTNPNIRLSDYRKLQKRLTETAMPYADPVAAFVKKALVVSLNAPKRQSPGELVSLVTSNSYRMVRTYWGIWHVG